VICRLKDSKVLYEYKGKRYRLSELYQKVKSTLRKDSRTGLLLRRLTVKLPGSEEEAVIVFAKGYHEPEDHTVKGKKKDKEPRWVAFLSTDTRVHASTIIKKYIKRWTIEVCFKECKQLLGLGKDQSNDFNAQVFSTTASFLRYNLLNFLNEKENYNTIGDLFQDLADESATITYSQRLWDFFRGLFQVAISEIFDLFEIEEQCSSYINAFTQVLCASIPFRGCET
jgi:IS4 transposase